MIDYKIIKNIWKIKKLDMIPLLVTFCACFYKLEFGLLFGMAISLIFVLYPQIYPSVKNNSKEVTTIKVGNGVLYVGIDHITSHIENIIRLRNPPSVIVLDLSGVTDIDYTVVNELTQTLEQSRKVKSKMLFTNVSVDIREILIKADLGKYITAEGCSVNITLEESLPLR